MVLVVCLGGFEGLGSHICLGGFEGFWIQIRLAAILCT